MKANNPFYICRHFYLFLYETKEIALTRGSIAVGTMASAETAVKFWSEQTNSKVTYSNPSEPIFLIKAEDFYWNVIIGEKIGWIIAEEWLGIKELNNAKQ